MTNPEALTPEQRRMVRADFLRSAVEEARYQRGRLVKVTTEDFALLLDGLAIFDAGLADAERAARQTPDTSGLLDRIRRETREAVQEGDRQDCSSPDCIADAVYEIVRAALAATATERPLDVERLARAYIRVRGAHNPTADELEGDEEVRPCAWCRLAASQHIEAAARLTEGG